MTELEVRIAVDGESLANQPPIPFFAADGFASGPTGPFNSKSDDRWRVGETASLELAGTNAPRLTEGSTVTVARPTGTRSFTSPRSRRAESAEDPIPAESPRGRSPHEHPVGHPHERPVGHPHEHPVDHPHERPVGRDSSVLRCDRE